MSTDYLACHGHLLPASNQNLEALGITPKIIDDNVENPLDFSNYKDIESYVNTILEGHRTIHVPTKFNMTVEIFTYYEENGSCYDEIDEGSYILFSTDQLFKPTELNDNLSMSGILPEEKAWVEYG